MGSSEVANLVVHADISSSQCLSVELLVDSYLLLEYSGHGQFVASKNVLNLFSLGDADVA